MLDPLSQFLLNRDQIVKIRVHIFQLLPELLSSEVLVEFPSHLSPDAIGVMRRVMSIPGVERIVADEQKNKGETSATRYHFLVSKTINAPDLGEAIAQTLSQLGIHTQISQFKNGSELNVCDYPAKNPDEHGKALSL